MYKSVGRKHIVILGAGFAGTYAALRFEKALKHDEPVDITLVSQDNFFVFTPMLPEVVSAGIEPRHVLTPLRTFFRRVDVQESQVEAMDLEHRVVTTSYGIGRQRLYLHYDYLMIALGSIVDLSPFPGLAQHGLTLKNVADAIHLRNHIIALMEQASLEGDEAARRQLLTFVVAGGGYAGVEVVAEMGDFVRDIAKFYPKVDQSLSRIVLVQMMDRLLPELSREMGSYALKHLQKQGVEVKLNTTVTAATAEEAILSTDERIATKTLLCAVGNAPHPLIRTIPCKKNSHDRIVVNEYLELPAYPDVWAVGDCAAVVDPRTGRPCPPSGQYAVREGELAAANILASLRQQEKKAFRYSGLGEFVALGRRSAVAEVKGFKFFGFLAWWLWRTVYLLKLPGLDRKVRVAIDWTLDLIFARDMVELKLTRGEKISRAHFEPGQDVFHQGDRAEGFYIIVRGEVEVVREGANGKEVTIARLGPGEFFGEMALLRGDMRRSATVRCVEPLDVIFVPGEDFMALATGSATLQNVFQEIVEQRRMPQLFSEGTEQR
ncbi:MAG: FAD-dependent oxidoreductase [Chloroflexi bacterium]|nr:FAD-dependent oxidoreductase [Chloroflexota bacterium]